MPVVVETPSDDGEMAHGGHARDIALLTSLRDTALRDTSLRDTGLHETAALVLSPA